MSCLVAKAASWTKGRGAPLLLYLHLMDSHTPYRFPPLDGKRRSGRLIEFPTTGMAMTLEESDSIRARYDGGVKSADAQAARLLDALEASGRPFVAVVTSDHGESLAKRVAGSTARALLRSSSRSRWSCSAKACCPAKRPQRSAMRRSLPTLLAAARSPCPHCIVDLRSATSGGVVEGGLPPGLAYRIDGRFKLVLDLTSGDKHLFDVAVRPAEKRDIARDRPALADAVALRVRHGRRPAAA